MEHNKSKVIVYCTDDYKRFRLIDGNRPINKKKIERIIQEIKTGNDVLDENPILVTDGGKLLDVNDGQHRLHVAEKLKRPVHYIIKKKDMKIVDIARVNSNTEKWSAINFINAYKKDNENYRKLAKFHETYGIAIGTCLTMLTFGEQKTQAGAGEKLAISFQNGTFEVKKYKEAVQVAEICKQFEKYPQWNGRNFVAAISRIIQHGECNFDVLVKKFLRDPSKMKAQSNTKGCLNNLQEIYNYDNNKQKPIY